MRFEIKNRYTGEVMVSGEAESLISLVEQHCSNLSWADLSGANLTRADLTRADLTRANLSWADLSGANLTGANLTWANLTWANLYGADLTGADLTGADLSWANLTGADLTGANLTRANLYGANLTGARGIHKCRTTPLYMLLDQPGKIRAYKLVRANGRGPYYGGITYAVGREYSVEADTDEQTQCSHGISLASLDWCMGNWQPEYRILIAEFEAADIAAIPVATDGKFRVHRCKIVGEKNLVELGLKGESDETGMR